MYEKIPPVLTAEELLDKAFKKANKVEVREKHKLKREKRLTERRLDSLSSTISSKIQSYIAAFPSMNREDVFEEALIDLLIGTDKMKHSLGALDWTSKTVLDIANDAKKKRDL